MSCGIVYLRPKKLMLEKLNDPQLFKAYLECEDMQIIQGIDSCIKCAPENIINTLNKGKMIGHC
jgi:hypothetical protein